MKVSIITATYNSIRHLHDVVGSIRQQTYPEIEYIVIDGGSTDGSVEYLHQSNLVHHLVSEPDKGIYDALNKGIKIATGDIIGFLHSDDILASPNTLRNIVRSFGTISSLTQKVPDVVYGDLVFVANEDTNKIARYWKSAPFEINLLMKGWMPPHPTVFMRRQVYEKHGLFDINLKCSADYDYMIRVFRDNTLTFTYLHEVITKMRIGGVSTSGIRNLFNKKIEDYHVLQNNGMPFPLWVLLSKNFSKIPQLLIKENDNS